MVVVLLGFIDKGVLLIRILTLQERGQILIKGTSQIEGTSHIDGISQIERSPEIEGLTLVDPSIVSIDK